MVLFTGCSKTWRQTEKMKMRVESPRDDDLDKFRSGSCLTCFLSFQAWIEDSKFSGSPWRTGEVVQVDSRTDKVSR